MSFPNIFKALSLAFVVSACAPDAQSHESLNESAPLNDTVDISTPCDPSLYVHMIGSDAEALTKMALPKRHRIVKPGRMMTMDFLEDRVNFFVGPNGTIDRITCG